MLPSEDYRSRREVWSQKRKTADQLFVRIGNVRLGLGILEAVVAYLVFGPHLVSPWLLALPVLAFIPIAFWHAGVMRKRTLADRAIAFYNRALARLDYRWVGTGSSGDRFRDSSHVYSDELDLFGRGSLFELVADTRTAAGEKVLADWLLSPASLDEARARQQAAEELRNRVDLRETLALLGPDMQAEVSVEALSQWGAAPVDIFPSLLRWMCALLACLSVTLLVMFFAQRVSLLLLAAVFGIDLLIGSLIRQRVSRIINGLEPISHGLRILSLALAHLEKQTFQSPRLQQSCSVLRVEGKLASVRVDQLANWIDWNDSTDHPLIRALRPILLWGEQIAMGVETWRRDSAPLVATWLYTLAEFEALSSLASLSFERPAWCFPELAAAAEPLFVAQDLKHPLLADRDCVGNDLALGSDVRLLIVSGSNMSGKSTFLRAIGLNTALAWAGGPVAATALRISPLALGASIRVTDSLLDNRSRFYAEILRISQVVTLAKGPTPVLFLLDELLSGTNSHDRQIGASAIARKLVELGAIGLLTTHDLALSVIQEELTNQAVNAHFDDKIVNGQMVFDYRLRSGIVTHSNALELMRSVGLDV